MENEESIMDFMINPIQPAVYDGTREAVYTNHEIPARYIGVNPRIKDAKGTCYFSHTSGDTDFWYFLFNGEKYLVKWESLKF